MCTIRAGIGIICDSDHKDMGRLHHRLTLPTRLMSSYFCNTSVFEVHKNIANQSIHSILFFCHKCRAKHMYTNSTKQCSYLLVTPENWHLKMSHSWGTIADNSVPIFGQNRPRKYASL